MAGGTRSRRPATAHSLLLLIALVALTTAGKQASAAIFRVTNLCSFTVWPAAIPAGGGTQLEPGQGWIFKVPAGMGGRVWGRTGCRLDTSGHLWCASGDCAGAFNCQLSGKPPTTLAEFTIGAGGGAADYYDLSVVDGFNLPVDFWCDGEVAIRCRDPGCPDANHHPNEGKVRRCKAGSDYHVVFCPK